MVHYADPVLGSCSCGAVHVQVRGALTRFFCHCTICQRVTGEPFGEPVFTYRWQLDVDDPSRLSWKRHRWTPINLSRGTCRTCGDLVVEHLAASPLSVVASTVWKAPERLPASRGHVFYETRVADIDDDLPKRSGYFSSELAITRWVVDGMLGR